MTQETQGPVIVQGQHLSTISRLFRVQDFIPSNEALKSQDVPDLPPTYAELFTVQTVPTDRPSQGPCSAKSILCGVLVEFFVRNAVFKWGLNALFVGNDLWDYYAVMKTSFSDTSLIIVIPVSTDYDMYCL